MPDTTAAKKNIEKAIAQVLDREMSQMRNALVEQVLQHLPEAIDAAAPASDLAQLVKAVAAIQGGTTQREILRALLDNSVRYCGRTALFVVKNGAATGWQSRGFSAGDDDPIKDFPLEIRNGLAERAGSRGSQLALSLSYLQFKRSLRRGTLRCLEIAADAARIFGFLFFLHRLGSFTQRSSRGRLRKMVARNTRFKGNLSAGNRARFRWPLSRRYSPATAERT